jgi:hypothetical protein
MPALVTAYLQWKHQPRATAADSDTSLGMGSHVFEVGEIGILGGSPFGARIEARLI